MLLLICGSYKKSINFTDHPLLFQETGKKELISQFAVQIGYISQPEENSVQKYLPTRSYLR